MSTTPGSPSVDELLASRGQRPGCPPGGVATSSSGWETLVAQEVPAGLQAGCGLRLP